MAVHARLRFKKKSIHHPIYCHSLDSFARATLIGCDLSGLTDPMTDSTLALTFEHSCSQFEHRCLEERRTVRNRRPRRDQYHLINSA